MITLDRHSWNDSPVRVTMLLLALAVPLGIAVLFVPMQISAVAVAGLAIWVCSLFPRPEIVFLSALLLVQDPLQVLAGGVGGAGMYVKRADEPLIVLLGVSVLLVGSVRRAFLARWLFVPIAVCYAGLLISSVFRPVGLAPAVIDLVLFSKPFLLLAIGMSLNPSNEAIEAGLPKVLLVLLVVLGVALPVLLFPDLQQAYLADVGHTDQRLGFRVAQGYFTGSAIYGWVGVATFGLAYAAYLTLRTRTYLFAAAFAGFCVVLTWRRKSLVALAVIVLASVMATRIASAKLRAFLAVSLLVLLAVTMLGPYLGSLAERTVGEIGSGDPYADPRTTLYYTSLLIARDHFPLGTGLASFGGHASRMYYSDVYNEYRISGIYGLSPLHPHYITDTFWPMVLGQGGVLSLVAFLGFFVILSWTALRTCLAHDLEPVTRFLAMASLFLLLGAFLESMASHLYGSSLQSALLFFVVGMFWRHERERALRLAGA